VSAIAIACRGARFIECTRWHSHLLEIVALDLTLCLSELRVNLVEAALNLFKALFGELTRGPHFFTLQVVKWVANIG
jgi:hypothetical protein